MNEEDEQKKNEGVFNRISPFQIALGLTLVWSIAFFIPVLSSNLPQGGVASPVFSFLTFLMPILFIWLAAVMIVALRSLRIETAALRRAVEAMHRNLEGEMAAQAEERDSWSFFQQEQLARFKAFRPEERDPSVKATSVFKPFEPSLGEEENSQYGLPLSHPKTSETVPLSTAEIVRALNFPNNADDKEGLRLMRRASEDRGLASLAKNARAVLTDLSQDGIFMDDLVPDAPQAQVWRRFAKGVRGPAIAALGGIRDRSALALAKGRLKGDVEFREISHNLLREFDRFVLEFEKTASDDDLLALGQTRTGRAFMLLGRCTGTFEKTG